MKYTSKIERKSGGTSWVFKPPQDASSAGVVKAQTFRDGRTARVEVPKLIDKVDAFRRGLNTLTHCHVTLKTITCLI